MNNTFQKKLLKITEDNNYRELKCSNGIDFSSNDYLGLSNHPKIKEAIIKAMNTGTSIGSTGSRLLTGSKKEHMELEEFAAEYFNSQACLFFSSGFLANYSLFTTLPDRHDFIIYDELIHASVRDGIRASEAKSLKFKHNDLDSLKEQIKKAKELKADSIWISIESVYSMDGDFADISGVLEIIKPYNNIYLVIDEAHATGIFGVEGKGFSFDLRSRSGNCLPPAPLEGEGLERGDSRLARQHDNIIALHTCSKALGVSGALICASKEIVEYLINKSRPFIYTTAESPLIAVAVKEALMISQNEPQHREKLLELVEYTHNNYLNFAYLPSPLAGEGRVRGTQIIPIVLNDSLQALNKAFELQSKGFDVRAIRPPTVVSARLRISLNANRTKGEIDRLFEVIR